MPKNEANIESLRKILPSCLFIKEGGGSSRSSIFDSDQVFFLGGGGVAFSTPLDSRISFDTLILVS